MFKNMIAPVQAWLLSQGRCVGCGLALLKATKQQGKAENLVICKCGRVYVDEKNNKFRRALLSEV